MDEFPQELITHKLEDVRQRINEIESLGDGI